MGTTKHCGISMKHSYSDTITHKAIGIVGIIPPILGGISIHIERVYDRFLQQRNKVYIFNPEQKLRNKLLVGYICKLASWLLWKRSDYVFFHATYVRGCIIDLLIITLFARKQTLVIIEHDCRHMKRRGTFFKKLYRWVLRRCQKVVFIGDSSYKSYLDAGIIPENYSIESAFLPPTATKSIVEQAYPSSLLHFIKEYTPILMVNASHLMRIDGKDVYGLDLTLTMLTKLKKKYPDVGLIMAIARIDDAGYFDYLKKSMSDLNIAEQVFVLQGNHYIWPLFKRIDLFVRPTLSDGHSISIEEALYYKIPVVTSNVVTRPEGVITFDISENESYVEQVDKTLQERVYGNYHQRDSLHAQSSR